MSKDYEDGVVAAAKAAEAAGYGADAPRLDPAFDVIGRGGGMGATTPAGPRDPLNPKDALAQRENKADLSLNPPVANEQMARALMNGAAKYGAWNWRRDKVKLSVYVAAAKRHLDAIMAGEDTAVDSGISHAGHVMAGMAILLDARAYGQLVDDRPAASPGAAIAADLRTGIKPLFSDERSYLGPTENALMEVMTVEHRPGINFDAAKDRTRDALYSRAYSWLSPGSAFEIRESLEYEGKVDMCWIEIDAVAATPTMYDVHRWIKCGDLGYYLRTRSIING